LPNGVSRRQYLGKPVQRDRRYAFFRLCGFARLYFRGAGKYRLRKTRNRSRVTFETDGGGSIPVGSSQSSGSITIASTCPNNVDCSVTKTNTAASAVLTISGNEGSHNVCTTTYISTYNGDRVPVTTCSPSPDSGWVGVTIQGFTATAYYQSGSNAASVAAALAAALNVPDSPVTTSASYSNVTITAPITRPSGQYAFTTSHDGVFGDFSAGSATTALQGGWVAGTYYDTGTITATVSDTTAQVHWGQGSTPASLAMAINAESGVSGVNCPSQSQIATAAGFVTACASGATVALTSVAGGPDVDWSVTASAVDTNPTYFSASGPNQYTGPLSFSATSTSMHEHHSREQHELVD